MSYSSGDINLDFRVACFNGETENVGKMLIDPRVDPSLDNNYALRWASKNEHHEIVNMLLRDGRVDPRANGGRVERVFWELEAEFWRTGKR